MGVKWTTEQQKVISLRDSNILVSAAAGSGKTAVLVERIITRLTKDKTPLNVDELLIVTFTEAAASEMRERILAAIEKALIAEPQNEHLQKQATLIHSASITTIHSFCLSVIREYFHVIDLDPGFRIGDEGELKLLKQEVIENLIINEYENAKPEFLHFVECMAPGKHDKNLEEIILKIYEFSRSYPIPKIWLQECVKNYSIETLEELEESIFAKIIKEDTKRIIEDLKGCLQQAIAVCNEADGPLAYEKTLQSDQVNLESIEGSSSYQELCRAFALISWSRLAPNKDKTNDPDKVEYVKSIREMIKDSVKSLKEQYFAVSVEQVLKDIQDAKQVVQILVDLVNRFSSEYRKEKTKKNLIDYGDMEHFALQILTEEQEGELVPSAIAKAYQEKFGEIMIDEYQDSNLIQEAILTSVSKVNQGIYNVFMVGDVKQSIYSFRLSRPELFMEKFHSYSTTAGERQRIDLHKNFRSRGEVLDSTNYIFYKIMQEQLGGIAYDKDAALYVGADYETKGGNEAEILVFNGAMEKDALEEEDTDRELEARAVARRIKELIKNHTVLDKQTGEYRTVRYSDIVLLTRSMKGWSDVFSSVLNDEGIPTNVTSKEGYFSTWEIGLLLDYLRVIDNKRQDIPLTTILRSPIGKLTDEELAKIRSCNKELSFYQGVLQYAKDEALEDETKEKLNRCLNQIHGFRQKAPHTPIHELLWEILRETGLEHYIYGMPGGQQRKANVEMLIEKAMDFERSSYKGMFHFIRYIEQLHKYEVDFGEASITDEKDDTVRIMSIHKSKGLEFPVVFVIGMGKGFNAQDTKSKVVTHPILGLGIDTVDPVKRTKAKGLMKKVIQRQLTLDMLGEELRVLYVAMTRAKEKLILTGKVKDYEKMRQGLELQPIQGDIPLNYSEVAKARSYYDWILPCVLKNPLQRPSYIKVREILEDELIRADVQEEVEEVFDYLELQQLQTQSFEEVPYYQMLKQQLSYTYPYEKEGEFTLKFTVSELKKRYVEEDGQPLIEPEVTKVPNFIQEQSMKENKGAIRGTAYHRVMECIDFKREYEPQDVKAHIEQMVKEGKIEGEIASAINPDDVYLFLQSDIGKRMREADLRGKLFKEQPFVIGIPAMEIYGVDSEEIILIQGVIDVYFEEDGKNVLLDYKTDKVKTAQKLREKYAVQLDYYGRALEQLTGYKTNEKIIYSFTLQCVI